MMTPNGYTCRVIAACDLGDVGAKVTLPGTARDHYVARRLVAEIPEPTVAERVADAVSDGINRARGRKAKA